MQSNDPVMFREDAMKGPSWGFWDETWTNFCAGFPTEEAAREGLRQFTHYIETGETTSFANITDLYWEG